ANRAKIEELVRQLGAKDWHAREKAVKALIKIGDSVIPAVTKAMSHEDPEVRMRAERILKALGQPHTDAFFAPRFAGRQYLLDAGGGRQTESAVLMGLFWLKNHQNPDGMWSCRKFMLNCKKGTCTGPGKGDEFDTGVTGLAVLAILGAGQTHAHGKFKETMKTALWALIDRQDPQGRIGPEGGNKWFYNHAIATMAVVEAYALSDRSPILKGPAQKAVDFLVACKNPRFGWRYGCRSGENDSSCTAWALAALKSAKAGGLTVPEGAFTEAVHWFDRTTDETRYRTGYTQKGDKQPHLPEAEGKFVKNEAMTAAAVFCRILVLEEKARNRPEVLGGGHLIRKDAPLWSLKAGTIDLIYWYWGSLLMFQLGGDFWRSWNEPLKKALVPTQQRKGCVAGSWDPVGAWGTAGGRVYATAINLLNLEVYFRYGRLLEKK
ncbi:MAG: HEAT repeat domain-containing protein, partial [Planctomycetota bacterium]